MDFNSFLSWEILATFAGVAACTGLLTQMLKSVTEATDAVAVLHHRCGAAGNHNGSHGRLDTALDGLGAGAAECGLGQPGKQRRVSGDRTDKERWLKHGCPNSKSNDRRAGA